MRVVKIVAGVLAAIVGLLVIGVAIFAWTFDPNDYKGYITAFVEDRTGRTFRIDDDLELAVFPWLAVETGGISIGNAPGFSEQDFATIDSASASIRVWPLLKRQIEFGTIVIEGIQLNLDRDEQGLGNWEDLLAGDADAEPLASSESEDAPIASLDIAGIAIRDGRILWRESGEVRYIVDNLTIGTGAVNEVEPVEVSLAFGVLDVASQSRFEIDTELTAVPGSTGFGVRDVSADLRLLDSQQTVRASGELALASLSVNADAAVEIGALRSSGRLVRPPTGPDALDVDLSWMDARYEPQAQELTVNGLVTRTGGVEARWQLTGASVLDDPRLSGSVVVAADSIADGLRLLEISVPAYANAAMTGRLDATAAFSAEPGTRRFEFSELDARLLGMSISGNATLDANRLDAVIDIPAFMPDDALFGLVEARIPPTVDLRAIDSVALNARVGADLDSRAVSIDAFRLALLGGTVSGSLTVEPNSNGSRLKGALETSRFSGAAVEGIFGELLGDVINPKELGSFALNTRFDLDTGADRTALTETRVEAFGLNAAGELTVSNASTAPQVSGRARLSSFDPRDLLRRFGQPVPQTSDDNVLKRASIEARFRVDAQTGVFEDIDVALDDSRITGSFTVNDFENPSYAFTLAADVIDVDRYLPPSAEEAQAGERKAGDIELAPEPLNNLRLQGHTRVGNLKLANLRFQDVETDLAIGDGEASIDSARAKLYGGEFDGGFYVNTTGEQPTMTLRGRAENLALEPLIDALVGDANLSGTGSFDLDLTGRGASVTENLHSAAGNMSFALRDGSIRGFNLGRSLCAAYNTTQQLPPPASAPDVTEYQLIQAAATVSDGIATSPELLARAAFMDLTGGGRLALAEQRLDYNMRVTLTRSIGLARCDSMDRFIGDSIPFTIRGTVEDVEIKPDYSKLVREEIKDRARDQLEDRLRDRLRDLL